MKPNLLLLLGTAVLFGIATGIYEFILPFFLKAQHMSFMSMGVIFAISGLFMVIARIYLGGLADTLGRKPLYTLALVVCGGATLFSPLLPTLLWQTVLKSLRELGSLTRETLYPTILYEEQQGGFLNRIGRFRGMEYLLQAAGTLVAGLGIKYLGDGLTTYTLLFILAGIILMSGAVWWHFSFHERRQRLVRVPISLRALFNLDLHANLKILLITGIIFTFAMQLSHCFILQLFFTKKFSTIPGVMTLTSGIMVIHRITIAIPMLLVGFFRLKNLRGWYIAGLLIEGCTMTVSALIPNFLWAAGIFLLHDLIGAGIWAPIQATLIQRYSRNETRAIEVGKVLAWGSIGTILGPLVAGVLAQTSISLPFLASGILMGVSAIPLLWLNAHAPEPAQGSVATQPSAAV